MVMRKIYSPQEMPTSLTQINCCLIHSISVLNLTLSLANLSGNNLTADGRWSNTFSLVALLRQIYSIYKLDSFGQANAAGPKRSRKIYITETHFPSILNTGQKEHFFLVSSEMKLLLLQEIPGLIYSRSELPIPFERLLMLLHPVLMSADSADIWHEVFITAEKGIWLGNGPCCHLHQL